jgi:hypothetical protein
MFESEEVRLLDDDLQWHTLLLKKGENVRGWVCGPLMLITCHYTNNASRPCRDKITRGGMLCYCAKEPTSSRQKGYLPIRTPDGRKLVVLMAATTAKRARLMAPGTPVEFWRPDKNNTALCFKVLLAAELGEQTTTNMQRKTPDDIRRYLVEVLWQDRALVEYFARAPRVSANPLTCEPPEPSRKKKIGAAPPARENASPLAGYSEGIGLDPNKA